MPVRLRRFDEPPVRAVERRDDPGEGAHGEGDHSDRDESDDASSQIRAESPRGGPAQLRSDEHGRGISGVGLLRRRVVTDRLVATDVDEGGAVVLDVGAPAGSLVR